MSNFEQILISIGGTTVLFGAVVWLGRNAILTRLKASVGHEFNAKLENIKSTLRSKEAEIAAIRQSAATLFAGRGHAVESRRLEAIDDLWEGFLRAKKRSYAMYTLASLKLDAAGDRIEKEPNLQEFFKAISPGDGLGTEDWNFDKANQSRPWVTALAWAYFSAYSSMVGYCTAWLQTAKIGLNPQVFISQKHVNALLALAIPEVTFDEGKDNTSLFVSAGELLESKLVLELKDTIDGKKADQNAIDRAKLIAAAANTVATDVAEAERKVIDTQAKK